MPSVNLCYSQYKKSFNEWTSVLAGLCWNKWGSEPLARSTGSSSSSCPVSNLIGQIKPRDISYSLSSFINSVSWPCLVQTLFSQRFIEECICQNDLYVDWTSARIISALTEHTLESFACWLSIRQNHFHIVWAYAIIISTLTEHMPESFPRWLSIRQNHFHVNWAYAESFPRWQSICQNHFYVDCAYARIISTLTDHTPESFPCWLIIRQIHFHVDWAYVRIISTLTEHTPKGVQRC